DFGDPVDRHAALQLDPLLQADVGAILRRLDERVPRYERAVGTQARAEGAARDAHITAIRRRAPNAGAQIVQRADLESVADFPDAGENRAMTLVGRRQPVRSWAAEIVRDRERHDRTAAHRLAFLV